MQCLWRDYPRDDHCYRKELDELQTEGGVIKGEFDAGLRGETSMDAAT